jgi:hypothetical protein
MNATDENKIESIDSNDTGENNASQSKSPTDSIVGTFGEPTYTTESDSVMECLGNWTKVVKRSSKDCAKKD